MSAASLRKSGGLGELSAVFARDRFKLPVLSVNWEFIFRKKSGFVHKPTIAYDQCWSSILQILLVQY